MYRNIITCDTCSRQRIPQILRDDEFNLPQPGYVGRRYWETRVLLVGQNPGTSNEKFNDQDESYAEVLRRVADEKSVNAMDALYDILSKIIPTWPVTRHFPLNDSGLELDDVACCNVVRCRTELNKNGDAKAPSTDMVRNCLSHLEVWLDWLQPAAVICVGKWAHERISPLLKSRNIPHSYINRMRSLSSAERQANRDEVVKLVRSVLGGIRSSHTENTAAKTTIARPPENAAATEVTQVEVSGSDEYAVPYRVEIGGGLTVVVGKATPTLFRLDLFRDNELVGEYERSKGSQVERKIDEIRAALDLLVSVYDKHGCWEVRWSGTKRTKCIRVAGQDIDEIPKVYWRG